MKPQSMTDLLVERGLDPAQRDAKLALFSAVLETWRMTRPDAAEHVWWVPGRLEVFGKHTDYAGGRTLVCAAPRGFAVIAGRRPDRTIRVTDAWRGETLVLEPGREPARLAGWRHYVDVAARRIEKNFPNDCGADIVLASDLPPASGMSSSSALVIGVASALARLANLHKTPQWKRNIRSTLDFAAYCACIENGRRFGALDGDAGVGTHGGSEDHAAICEALPGRVLAFAFVPPRALGAARVPADWRFVVATSVKAKKTGAAQESYNRLSDEVAALLKAWNESQSGPPAISLAAALATSADAPQRFRALAGPLRDRLEHFIREDARIPQAMEAFESGDTRTVGRLADESQREAEHLLGNQTPETNALAASARKQGAFAATNFGAGFGGAVWALVEAERAAEFAAAWHKDAFTVTPGPSLTELTTK